MKLIFEDLPENSLEEQEELYKALTEKALINDHTKFEYIRNTSEFFVMRQAVSGLETVINFYTTLCDELYNSYCAQVINGEADFNLLYIFRQHQDCISFYTEELRIAKDMLDEYWAYVLKWHFIEQWILFRDRQQDQLWDHRKDNYFGH